jgi:hypothetical protein
MRFRTAVEATEGLGAAYRPGLQALRNSDRDKIRCTNTWRLAGSVDLDRALSSSRPNDPRWDYGIAVSRSRDSDTVTWAEVHPASSTHLQAVLNKFAWLQQWLTASAPLLRKISVEYVWVASGRVHIPNNSPHRKRLSAEGIRFVGRLLQL